MPAWQSKWYTTTLFSFSDSDLCTIGQLVKSRFSLCTKRRGHTAYLWGGRGGEREREVLFLGGTVSEVTIPVHQRTFVYSLSAVFHRRIISSRSRLVDRLRLQKRQ